MSLLLQALVNGIALAAIYALIALGLTLVFGVLDVVNFAYGQMLLLAGYVTYELTSRGVGFWVALVVVSLGFALLGAALEKGLFAWVRDVPINGLLVSIGLIAVIENVIEAVWGPNQYMVERPLKGSVEFWDVVVAKSQLVNIAAALVIMAGLALLLRTTRFGRAMRATAQNRDAATLMGIPVNRINTLAFALGAVLAAVSGVLIVGMLPLTPALGDSYLVYGFVALIIGGAGSPAGAVVGAGITGVAVSCAQTFGSTMVAGVAPFVALILILYIRPQGVVRTRVESSL